MTRPASLIQSPDGDLYSVECVGEAGVDVPKLRLKFTVGCRFQTLGQRLFIGVLDPSCPWHVGGRRGIGVSIDTEDGTVVDLLNDLGVIDYVDGAPLEPGGVVEFAVDIEKQNRVLIAGISVNGESILHPAIYLEETDRLGAFVGTTLLWGGSATFDGPALKVESFAGTTALAS
jgi:hypothetical protein